MHFRCVVYVPLQDFEKLICRQVSVQCQLPSQLQLQHTRMIDESNPSCSICASVSVAADLKAVPKLLPCLEPKLGCATTPRTRHIFSVNTAQHKFHRNLLPQIGAIVRTPTSTAHADYVCAFFKSIWAIFLNIMTSVMANYVRVPIDLL